MFLQQTSSLSHFTMTAPFSGHLLIRETSTFGLGRTKNTRQPGAFELLSLHVTCSDRSVAAAQAVASHPTIRAPAADTICCVRSADLFRLFIVLFLLCATHHLTLRFTSERPRFVASPTCRLQDTLSVFQVRHFVFWNHRVPGRISIQHLPLRTFFFSDVSLERASSVVGVQTRGELTSSLCSPSPRPEPSSPSDPSTTTSGGGCGGCGDTKERKKSRWCGDTRSLSAQRRFGYHQRVEEKLWMCVRGGAECSSSTISSKPTLGRQCIAAHSPTLKIPLSSSVSAHV